VVLCTKHDLAYSIEISMGMVWVLYSSTSIEMHLNSSAVC
jgi:hypothetical protein